MFELKTKGKTGFVYILDCNTNDILQTSRLFSMYFI